MTDWLHDKAILMSISTWEGVEKQKEKTVEFLVSVAVLAYRAG